MALRRGRSEARIRYGASEGGAGRVGASIVAITIIAIVSRGLFAASSAIDQAFEQFWNASSPDAAAKTIDTIVKSGVTFDDAFVRLKNGRAYRADVPRGVVKLTHRLGA